MKKMYHILPLNSFTGSLGPVTGVVKFCESLGVNIKMIA